MSDFLGLRVTISAHSTTYNLTNKRRGYGRKKLHAFLVAGKRQSELWSVCVALYGEVVKREKDDAWRRGVNSNHNDRFTSLHFLSSVYRCFVDGWSLQLKRRTRLDIQILCDLSQRNGKITK